MPTMRSQPRLVYQAHMLPTITRFISQSLERTRVFCLGYVAEMTEISVYKATDQNSRQGKLAYVHFRN
jgi:mannonate dehydratase